MIERNIIITKAGGTAGKNSVNYKISLPAEMVKALGVTRENKTVLVSFDKLSIYAPDKSENFVKNYQKSR